MKFPLTGKTRTREHVLADLGVNHLERYVLLCGHTMQRVQADYGYDATMSTYSNAGEAEAGAVFFQVKATDQAPLLKGEEAISWRISKRDLKLWLSEAYPVVLVVYDGQREKAHWLHVQSYFAGRPTAELFTSGETVTVHIPATNRVNRWSIQRLARAKNDVHTRFRRKVHPHG